MAEEERRKISQRTKAALAAAKARGVELGRNGKALADARAWAADQFALFVAPALDRIERAGHCTLMEKAHEMNRQGVPTPTGSGRWHISTVHRLVKRIEALRASGAQPCPNALQLLQSKPCNIYSLSEIATAA